MTKNKSGAGAVNDLRSELVYDLPHDGEVHRLVCRPSFNMLARLELLLGDENGSISNAPRELLSAPASRVAETAAIIFAESPNLPQELKEDPDALLDAIVAAGPLNLVSGPAPIVLMMLSLLHMGPAGLIDWEAFAPDDDEDEDKEEEAEKEPAPFLARLAGVAFSILRQKPA